MNHKTTAAAPQTTTLSSTGKRSGILILLTILLAIMVAFFHRSFVSNQVLFSNDGPLGIISSQSNQTSLSAAGGVWQDLNWLGAEGITPAPNFSMFLIMLLKPLAYAKFAAPLGLLILGCSAWLFFRQLRLAPLACIAGGIAAALNSDFFSTACWGVVAQSLCVASNYLALAALARLNQRSRWSSWVNVALAGLAVGMGVMQGWDVGALFSLVIAGYVLYQAIFMREDREASGAARKLGLGITRIAVVAAFALLIGTGTLTSLVGTQIVGVAGMAQDEATRQARWAAATQWSLPKAEILQTAVPGLFGYRQNWHMYNDHQPTDNQYWGIIGQNLSPDDFTWRLSGTGLYAGVFVLLVSLWALCQSLRKRGSPFEPVQRRAIWFWSAVLVATALLSFGKYLPSVYKLFYALPYVSTIRNPTKFMHVFSWALIIVFAHGMHGIYTAYMKNAVRRPAGISAQFKAWWSAASNFEQWWGVGSILAIVASAVVWLIYSGKMEPLKTYLESVGIPAEEAPGVAHFSVMSVGWFVLFLALAVGLLWLVFAGFLSGSRAKWGGALILALLLLDLGRADAPWIVYLNTSYEYANDPVVDFMADKPYEQRVFMPQTNSKDLPYVALFKMYGTAWKQHLFWYHNVECTDIVQEPRMTRDKESFLGAIRSHPLEYWELTNTRYFLGQAGLEKLLNRQFDPQQQRFKLAQFRDGLPATFNLTLKPDAPPRNIASLEDVISTPSVDFTTVPATNGQLAVIEFTGALPRASLIPTWQVMTNDEDTLQALANADFDPHQTVLVAESLPQSPPGVGGAPGSVSITDYKPKRIALKAEVSSPSVLLMADCYNPNWKVTVDGKPGQVLRCNYIERGVYLTPGRHDVVFGFQGNYTPFCVSLSAGVMGMLLCLWRGVESSGKSDERRTKG